jgi:hypothetical protein
MNSSRVALVAALAAAACWTLKAVAIGAAGGLGQSPFEGPLFLAGLVCFVVSAVALGVALTRGRPAWVRAVTGLVVAPVVGVGFTAVVDALVGALQPMSPLRHWAWSEVNLWVVAVVGLGVALAVRRAPAGRGGTGVA